jgi:alkyl sulfatase BDS1-like metallo-beta-lactamase superfamily hydrolase
MAEAESRSSGMPAFLVTSTAALLLALAACERPAPPAEAPSAEIDAAAPVHPQLAAHTAEFERKVYAVTDGVHQAVGFGLANSILVEGDDCVFVVDAMGSVESARAVRAEFEKITRKPIAALIYTHNHADHIFGARGFVPDGEVDVYAHATTNHYIDRLISVLRPIIGMRAERMFGNHLPREGPDRLVNAGIGPFLEAAHGGGTLSLIRPNKTFADRMDVTLCGVRAELVHAPGETNDQIFVWLPEKKVLLPGDNVYKAFPNLYTIRGTLYRDVLAWVRSLDAMRALRPEHLAPSHTRPVSGAEQVDEILTAYRDAIQYVHDQTIRGMNQGLTPDELVERIELPPHLASHPYLQEFYGTVEWSVRSIFAGTLGWFDGDTATLSPVSPADRAAGMVALAGGEDALLAATRAAVEQGRYEWAAELASHLIRFDPDLAEARRLKARALRALGRRSISPNARNYYLTQALELEGAAKVEELTPTAERVELAKSMPIGNFIAAMPANLDPRKSAEVDTVMGFRFPDVGEAYALHVRRGIAEVRSAYPEEPDVAISADSRVWIEVVAGVRSLPAAMATGAVEVEGGVRQVPAVLRFLALFRR